MKICTTIDKVIGTTKNYLPSDKPLVSILLAVYKPNKKWFIEQLISLNEQKYENIELLIYDDCPESLIDEKIIKQYITNFPYKITRSIENKGSNKAFEELTKMANGELFAYCDQDDIWELNKIVLMVKKFRNDNVTLVCSDLSIIDENSKKIANSITEIRRRHKFKCGNDLAKGLLMTNFITGCAMMVRKDICQKAIPFEITLVHDQWIAIIAAINGEIEFINKPLVRYRQHSFNQTGILTGICDKKTYYNVRIKGILNRYISLKERLSYNNELKNYINDCLVWIRARERYFFSPSFKDLKIMIKYRNFHKISIIIEVLLPFVPNSIFELIIKLTKKGII